MLSTAGPSKNETSRTSSINVYHEDHKTSWCPPINLQPFLPYREPALCEFDPLKQTCAHPQGTTNPASIFKDPQDLLRNYVMASLSPHCPISLLYNNALLLGN